ncbi:MAG TPA: hypothetical protein VGN72_10210 [Tepidisphaeraceae bacterium]|jgi:hypothetical protein|nr:hypothetical protein [Tepidisphaeraceae bacterium]
MTTMRFSLFTMLATLCLFLGGCGAQEGETVFTAGPTNPDVGGQAPYTGTYTLTTAANPNPVVTIQVAEGEPLGFRKAADGGVEAYYKDQSYGLSGLTSQAYWNYRKNL